MRYFVGFIITIGLIIVLILMLFGGGSKDKTKLPQSTKTLDSYSTTNAEARMTIDGPVNANQIHKKLQINVSKDEVTYKQYTGYEGKVTKRSSYQNNQNAYANFLRALAVAGFTRGSLDEQLKDERGQCPLGSRYIFEFIQDDKQIERYWATSCHGQKSFLGAFDINVQLFEAQVPDFDKVNNNFSLS